jgi:hypothetical protein
VPFLGPSARPIERDAEGYRPGVPDLDAGAGSLLQGGSGQGPLPDLPARLDDELSQRRCEIRLKVKAGRIAHPLLARFRPGEQEFTIQAASGERPEVLLNRAWAKELWRQSLGDLKGDPPHLEAFRLYLAGTPYATITAQTGLTDEAARMAIHRLKAQLREIVVGYIRQTVSSPDDLVGEVAHFMALLSWEGAAIALQDP